MAKKAGVILRWFKIRKKSPSQSVNTWRGSCLQRGNIKWRYLPPRYDVDVTGRMTLTTRFVTIVVTHHGCEILNNVLVTNRQTNRQRNKRTNKRPLIRLGLNSVQACMNVAANNFKQSLGDMIMRETMSTSIFAFLHFFCSRIWYPVIFSSLMRF